MKTLKNIARFVLMTFACGVTFFFFFILFCRTDLVFDLFNSKPVLLVLGLTIGAIIGLLVGAITTYLRFAKIVEEKDVEVKRLTKQLKKAEKLVTRLLPEVEQARKFNSAKSAEEEKNNSAKRSKDFFSQIGDLSESETDIQPTPEEEVIDNDEELEAQDEVADET